MDGPRDDHCKWSKSEKGQIWCDITCMRNLKNDTIYLQNRKRLIDIENKLWLLEGKGGEGEIN